MSFVFGLWVGMAFGAAGMAWMLLSPRGERTVIDRWWLGNEDRWLGLRDVLLKEEKK